MSGMDKAKAFCTIAHGEGWATKIETKNGDETHVRAERASEVITIWWRGNSLIETPFHHFGGQIRSLHNKATATRQLSLKPDPTKIVKRPPKLAQQFQVDENGELVDVAEVDIESLRSPLPFDIWEDTDNTILRNLRGSTIVYVNSIKKTPESVHIPRSMNMNLRHFNLTESSTERPIVNFVTPFGFRSVGLDSILRVM